MSTPRLHTFKGIGDIVVRLDSGREICVPAVRALDFDGGVAVITWAGATPLTYSSVLEVVSERANCHECGHRLYMHKRSGNGAYRCASFGCGCERAKAPDS